MRRALFLSALVLLPSSIAAAAPVTLQIQPASQKLPEGSTGQISVTINPVQGGDLTIDVSSSDPSVVEVAPSFVIPAGADTVNHAVKALKVGGAITITAQFQGSNNGDTALIEVTPSDGVVPMDMSTTPGSADAGTTAGADGAAPADAGKDPGAGGSGSGSQSGQDSGCSIAGEADLTLPALLVIALLALAVRRRAVG